MFRSPAHPQIRSTRRFHRSRAAIGTSAILCLVGTLAVPHAGLARASAAQSQSVVRQADASRNADDGSTVIVVQGSGQAARAPDRAAVVFGASAQAATASDAQRQVNQSVSGAIDAIRQLGIDSLVLQTGRVSLYPVYDDRPQRAGSSPREPSIVGYTATLTVSARMNDVGEVGRVIDTALQAGVNRVEGVTLSLIDDADVRTAALVGAVNDAREKAAAMARALRLELSDPIDVVEGGVHVLPMRQEQWGGRFMAAGDASASTPIESGEVTTSASVTIRYRTYKSPGRRPD